MGRLGTSIKGIGKLLLVHETPKDGAELLWSQEEMSLKDLEALLRGPKKNREALCQVEVVGTSVVSSYVRFMTKDLTVTTFWFGSIPI